MGIYMGNPRKSRHRWIFTSYLTLIPTFFRACGLVMGAGNQHRPETLLAGMDTTLAYLVVLAASILAQEEGPFQPPFLTPAHRSPCSRPGRFGSRGLCSAHSFFASSNLSRIEGLFSVSAFARSISSPLRPLLITPSIIP